MKSGRFLLLFCLLLPAAGQAAAVLESGVEGPSLWFESEVFTFSEVESGQTVAAFFPFANYGEGELVISNVQATCDCTSAYASPERLPPGGEGVIIVELDTSYRDGKLDKTVVVFTNDLARPEVTLHIQGNVFLPLTVNPSPLFIDGLDVGKTVVAEVTLMNTGKKPITVRNLTASEKDLTWQVSGKGNAEAKLPYKLEVQDYLWVRLTLTPASDVRKTIYRQLAVTVDPTTATPIILKIQGMFSPEEKGAPQ